MITTFQPALLDCDFKKYIVDFRIKICPTLHKQLKTSSIYYCMSIN